MLNTKEAALYLGISPYYLRNMRHDMLNHPGPKFTEGKHPRGKACYYTKEDLDEWAKNHKWKGDGQTLPPKKRKRRSEFLVEGDYLYA
jgi:hypothetical protein